MSRNNSLRILKTTQETCCVAKQEAHEATFRSLLWLTHKCPGRKLLWLYLAFFAEGKKQWKGNHFEKLESLYSHGRHLVVLGSPVAVAYKSQYFWLSALSYYFSPYLLLLERVLRLFLKWRKQIVFGCTLWYELHRDFLAGNARNVVKVDWEIFKGIIECLS